MLVNKYERLFAGIFPLVLLSSAFISLWLPPLLSIVYLIFSSKYSCGYGKIMAIKSLDLSFSFYIYNFIAFVFGAAASIVARDSGQPFFVVGAGSLLNIVIFLLMAFFFLSFIVVSVNGFLARKPKMPFVLKPFSFFYERSNKQ